MRKLLGIDLMDVPWSRASKRETNCATAIRDTEFYVNKDGGFVFIQASDSEDRRWPAGRDLGIEVQMGLPRAQLTAHSKLQSCLGNRINENRYRSEQAINPEDAKGGSREVSETCSYQKARLKDVSNCLPSKYV